MKLSKASLVPALLLLSAVSLFGLIPAGYSQAPGVPSEPAWPVTFNLYAPQFGMYGFAVTEPGPVTVVVQTGAPVMVRLAGPIAGPLQQQGTGVVQLRYVATPQDIQRGILWQVTVQPLGAPAVQAQGTVNIQHPAANPAAIQAAMTAHRAEPRPTLSPQQQAERTAAERAQRDTAFRQRQQAGMNELMQRRAEITRVLQPRIDEVKRAATPAANGVSSRGVVQMKLTPGTPNISQLSAAEGVPGDPILVSGTNLGSTGVLHFIIGPNLTTQDLAADALWGNGQIVSSVPDPSAKDPSVGAVKYNGYVYVVVAGVKSNFVPFTFDPIIDHRIIRVAASLYPADGNNYINGGREIRHVRGYDMFSGVQAMDVVYNQVSLQNGWVVEGLPEYFSLNVGGAFNGSVGPLLATIGSPSLQTQVFWSMGSSEYTHERTLYYYIEIPIRGPRAMPDGIVCVTKPPPTQPCPDIIQ